MNPKNDNRRTWDVKPKSYYNQRFVCYLTKTQMTAIKNEAESRNATLAEVVRAAVDARYQLDGRE